jgi:hypothetical protein
MAEIDALKPEDNIHQDQSIGTLIPSSSNNLELEKISIEKQKLEIEMQKLKMEKSKLFYSSLIGSIPLLAVIFTIFYGIWSQRQQEKAQFQLKAAEIMFTSKDGYEIKSRAEILKIILQDKLPSGFAEAFHPDSLGFNDMSLVNAKIELLKMLASKVTTKEEIVEYWRRAFREDNWADTLCGR